MKPTPPLKPSRILLVEDEPSVREQLEDYLRREGFEVHSTETLQAARAALKNPGTPSPDLILLDWMLPDGQGIEALKEWRRAGLPAPVILLTARADLVDKVVGLELGANDYVTKPFEVRELVARIRVQLRERLARAAVGLSDSSGASASDCIEIAGIRLEPSTRDCAFRGRPVELTRTEFELLRMLIENPNQVFSREELLKRVWGYERSPTTRTVDTHILQLRTKLDSALFETVHGIGYRFRFHKGLTPA